MKYMDLLQLYSKLSGNNRIKKERPGKPLFKL